MMGKAITLATAGAFALFLIASASGLAWAQKAAVVPRQATPAMTAAQSPLARFQILGVSGGSVTPATVTFTSSNPDLSVAGSVATTVRFTTTANPSFHIYAKANTAKFTGCNTPPAGAVTVTCSGPSANLICAGASALTNSGNGTVVATGIGNGTNTFSATYIFQDAWNYQVGTACRLRVHYIYTSP